MTEGVRAQQAGQYPQAEKHFKAAAREARKFGEEDPRLAATLNYLAGAYLAQGKMDEVEPLYRQCLKILEKAHGPESSDVAVVLLNIAHFYEVQASSEEGLRKLADAKLATPSNFPRTKEEYLYREAQIMRAEAPHYQFEMYSQAEPLYKRALAIREKALGPNNLAVAEVLESCASLLRKMDRKAEAEQLEARAKAIRTPAR